MLEKYSLKIWVPGDERKSEVKRGRLRIYICPEVLTH